MKCFNDENGNRGIDKVRADSDGEESGDGDKTKNTAIPSALLKLLFRSLLY